MPVQVNATPRDVRGLGGPNCLSSEDFVAHFIAHLNRNSAISTKCATKCTMQCTKAENPPPDVGGYSVCGYGFALDARSPPIFAGRGKEQLTRVPRLPALLTSNAAPSRLAR